MGIEIHGSGNRNPVDGAGSLADEPAGIGHADGIGTEIDIGVGLDILDQTG